MFYAYENGSQVEIQGLKIHVPPVGYVWDERTDELVYTGVHSRSPEPHLQYWEREPLPKWYEDRRYDEIELQKNNPEYRDPKIAEYVASQWDKRICGMWFMNNGKPTYITGTNWFYLNWWYLDGNYPEYRDTDREFFYAWRYVEQDPMCMGLIEVTRRRQGKTFRATCILYEYTSSREHKRAGIQSKSFDDAKDNVFQSKLMTPFRELPDFFIPEIDMQKGYGAKDTLRFFRTQKRGKGGASELGKPELKSQITVRNGKPKAFDGYPLHRYLNDEAGKDEEYSVFERHGVNYFCCLDGDRIVGKMLYTTTVEEMEAGGADFKKLWDGSNQNEIDKVTGQTKTGLYQYFLPAHRGVNYDRYGFPKEDENLAAIHAKRDQLSSDPRAKASYIRKAPLRIEEAFYRDSSKCLFDALKLEERREYLMIKGDRMYVDGDLVWMGNNRDTLVEFIPRKGGLFKFATLEFDERDLNNVRRQGMFTPMSTNKFVASCDPYAHRFINEDNAGSRAAAYVYKKGSIMSGEDPYADTAVMQYLGRPQHQLLFYEDMIKMCCFFGCDILVENNVPGLMEYFEDRGYFDFLMWVPEATKPGIASSPKSKQEATNEMEFFIHNYCEKIYFVELINDLLEFDIQKTEKYDAAMAFGWLLIANKKNKYIIDQTDELLDMYKVFGAKKLTA